MTKMTKHLAAKVCREAHIKVRKDTDKAWAKADKACLQSLIKLMEVHAAARANAFSKGIEGFDLADKIFQESIKDL